MDSNNLSTLWYALLGLIKMHPNTGYGLRKIFQATPMARYSGSPGAIYPALKNLESRKLIVGSVTAGKTGREKQTFRCTAKGTGALRDWLRLPVTPVQIQFELEVVLLRFSYLDLLEDMDWSIEFLRQFAQAIDVCRVGIEETKDSIKTHSPLHGRLAIDNGLDILAAHSSWAKNSLAILKRKQAGK